MMSALPVQFSDDAVTDTQDQSTFTIGLIAAAVAIVCFGCNLVPVKRVQTGDGMFYQWIECAAIWMVGLVVQILRDSPPVYPLAMVGGAIWTTGNMCVVPCLKTIGMGLGILLWGTTNLLVGWACGHFGLFGLAEDDVTRPTLNYLGLGFALLRLVLFLFVKADAGTSGSAENTEKDPLLLPQNLQDERTTSNEIEATDRSWVDRLSSLQKRIIGCSLALVSGCMYAMTMVPCLYIQQHFKGASQNGLDYAFSSYSGIFASSTVYFLIYSSYKQNRPQLPPDLIWPSALCGFMWGIAQVGWFVAAFNLSLSVSYPIVTAGPAVIAAAWGVFYFGEIRGPRNYIILLFGVLAVVAASVLSALSKI